MICLGSNIGYFDIPSFREIASTDSPRDRRSTTSCFRITIQPCPGASPLSLRQSIRQLQSAYGLFQLPRSYFSFFKPSPIVSSPLATVLYRKGLSTKAAAAAHICRAYRLSHCRYFSSVASTHLGTLFSAVRYEMTFQ